MVWQKKVEAPEIHNKYVKVLLEKMLSMQDDKEKQQLRGKLISFLLNSRHYRAEKLLSLFPMEGSLLFYS